MSPPDDMVLPPVAQKTPLPSSEYILTGDDATEIARLLHEHAGVRLRGDRVSFLRSRLSRRMRFHGLTSFASYLELVRNSSEPEEFVEMVDALTTNKTDFFREPGHFDFLCEEVLKATLEDLRVWSAGCATGEEAYSLAMTCRTVLPRPAADNVSILATDLSTHAIRHAIAGRYDAEAVQAIPRDYRARWWHASSGTSGTYDAAAELRELISFRQLNLMASWPMRGGFDLILCRNVMIYFDKETQQQLIDRFWAMLRPGGYLFVGHSESLSGLTHHFRYLQPAIYRKQQSSIPD